MYSGGHYCDIVRDIDTFKMYNMQKKCIVEDTSYTVTLCEIDTSKMYSMHKKCLIIEDTSVTLCEIDTSKMYSIHKKCHS